MTIKPCFYVYMIVHLTRASNNQFVSLTKQIANSGEGKIWETSLNGYLAKIYHDPTLERIEKLKVMLANPPADPMLTHNPVGATSKLKCKQRGK
jgi:DNA-binding helix-hairpin-helix protein with protein kinase domain